MLLGYWLLPVPEVPEAPDMLEVDPLVWYSDPMLVEPVPIPTPLDPLVPVP